VENARGKKKEKKGRIIGRIMSIRKDLEIQKKEEREEKKVIMVGRIKYGKSGLRIAGVYANGDMEKKLEELKKWLEEWEEGIKTIIGGISTQEQGEREGEEERKERERNPKGSKK